YALCESTDFQNLPEDSRLKLNQLRNDLSPNENFQSPSSARRLFREAVKEMRAEAAPTVTERHTPVPSYTIDNFLKNLNERSKNDFIEFRKLYDTARGAAPKNKILALKKLKD